MVDGTRLANFTVQIYYDADNSPMKIPETTIQGTKRTEIREVHALEEIPGMINLTINHSDFEIPKLVSEAVISIRIYSQQKIYICFLCLPHHTFS